MTVGIIGETSEIRAKHSRVRQLIEWPTVLLAVFIYGLWLAITLSYHILPFWIVAIIGSVTLAWHGSLQHEILHGHPTRWRAVNRAMGLVPLSLWIPYERYRQSHLVHHIDQRITDPFDDPESYYWDAQAWDRLGVIGQALVWAQTTLAGRLLIGPFWIIAHFLASEARLVIEGRERVRAIWAEHLLLCAPVVLWVTLVCGMPFWLYLLGIVVPATSLMLVRSFAEHRAAEGVEERTAIVENSWFFGPLFLFNNLHAAHHEAPTMPWYEIPSWYRENRERLIAANGGHLYNTYFDVARRYLFTPHHAPKHPFGRAPRRPAGDVRADAKTAGLASEAGTDQAG